MKDFPIAIQTDTVIRIFYSDKHNLIKEIELLKIIGMTKTGIRLSNGILVSKNSLFPYHHSRDYRSGEQYYFLDKIKM